MPIYIIFYRSHIKDLCIDEFCSLANSLEKAKELVAMYIDHLGGNFKWYPTNENMTKENNYIYIGCREDCDKLMDPSYDFGGFVIELAQIFI